MKNRRIWQIISTWIGFMSQWHQIKLFLFNSILLFFFSWIFKIHMYLYIHTCREIKRKKKSENLSWYWKRKLIKHYYYFWLASLSSYFCYFLSQFSDWCESEIKNKPSLIFELASILVGSLSYHDSTFTILATKDFTSNDHI